VKLGRNRSALFLKGVIFPFHEKNQTKNKKQKRKKNEKLNKKRKPKKETKQTHLRTHVHASIRTHTFTDAHTPAFGSVSMMGLELFFHCFCSNYTETVPINETNIKLQ